LKNKSSQNVPTESVLEAEMRDMGIARYRTRVAKAQELQIESVTGAGRRLLDHAHDYLTEGLVRWMTQAQNTPGRMHRVYPYLEKLPPEVAALIACKVIIDGISAYRSINSLCMAVGRAIEDEVLCRFVQETEPGLWKDVNKTLGSQPSEVARMALIRRYARYAELTTPRWPTRDKAAIGLVMIELMRQHTGVIDIRNKKNILGKDITLVRGTDEFLDWMTKSHRASEILRPVYMPMVSVPRDWVSVQAGGYTGEAFLLKPLVKSVRKQSLQTLDDQGIPKVLQAVNTIQRTAWRVNPVILQAVRDCWERGYGIGDMPPKDDFPLPPKPDDIAENYEARRAWRKAAARVHFLNEAERSKKIAVAKTVWLGEKYANADMYFPQELDFRGRIYPRPVFLQPQGADWQRAMLSFSNGQPLNEDGMRWLHIHGANCWGNDKVSYEERIAWTEEYAPMILKCAQDPWANQEWHGADKPFSFLAFCDAFARAHENPGEPCGLPVYIDGSNNGLQLFSLLLRDPVGALSTNCTDSTPQDIYQDVARRTQALLETEGSHLSRQWLAIGIERDTVKRVVMCLPYGLTPYSARRYVMDWYQDRIKDPKVAGLAFHGDAYPAVGHLTNFVWEAISEIVTAARQCMDWLRACAKLHVKHGHPVRWSTPSGFICEQRYGKLNKITVKTSIGTVVRTHRIMEETEILSAARNANGISPNYIHSMDSALLVATVNDCANNHGVRSFSTIHDSVGVIPNDVENLSQSIRNCAVEMFSDDILESTRREFEHYTGVSMPDPPKPGTFDLNQLYKAQYFFA